MALRFVAPALGGPHRGREAPLRPGPTTCDNLDLVGLKQVMSTDVGGVFNAASRKGRGVRGLAPKFAYVDDLSLVAWILHVAGTTSAQQEVSVGLKGSEKRKAPGPLPGEWRL